MELTPQHVSKTVSGQSYLYPMDLRLEPNQVTILLGARQPSRELA